MALVMTGWDLPAKDKLGEYGQKASAQWIPTIMGQPGIKEFRGYRTSTGASPEVMVHTEFDTLENAQAWVASEDFATQVADLRELGCSHVTFALWDGSPIVPEPIRPS